MKMDRLEELRENNNLTQTALAKILGIPTSTYQGYESGRYEPDFAMIKQIANFFSVSVDYLIKNDFAGLNIKKPKEITNFDEAYTFLEKHNFSYIVNGNFQSDIIELARVILRLINNYEK